MISFERRDLLFKKFGKSESYIAPNTDHTVNAELGIRLKVGGHFWRVLYILFFITLSKTPEQRAFEII